MDDVWGSIKSTLCKVKEYRDPIMAEVALGLLRPYLSFIPGGVAGYTASEAVLRSYFRNHKDCDGSCHNQQCLDELKNRVAKLEHENRAAKLEHENRVAKLEHENRAAKLEHENRVAKLEQGFSELKKSYVVLLVFFSFFFLLLLFGVVSCLMNRLNIFIICWTNFQCACRDPVEKMVHAVAF
ncbi:uncharacterized protein LOC116192266 isoform X1 [Punica granatum]|uniref:Uncharacterized protein LOC116192266 isoform X1 n=1 Tax=Punica granatum TaxID=22663 RepID=A0A6P8C233_PUNGR|nr:uncharacterized protein LOC116192266 isoform X1 [Punica granatum]XP_031376619.1 uncharacterized protein LOC116192266 isoform X1 [Punica granatum]XP_031376620.1 uncharacterized protein LOC116192266 isoform X1 [Punica granatum]XP_031376621.1 uncharacterized protein LOC116192266 isoform X1 [Punica granatum]